MFAYSFKTSVLILWLFVSMVHAELGPRGGTDLKPLDLERIKVGDKAPDFTLEDMNGSRISLSDFRGQQNVILVFYRGHW